MSRWGAARVFAAVGLLGVVAAAAGCGGRREERPATTITPVRGDAAAPVVVVGDAGAPSAGDAGAGDASGAGDAGAGDASGAGDAAGAVLDAPAPGLLDGATPGVAVATADPTAAELAAARALDQRLDGASDNRREAAALRAAVAGLGADEQRLLARAGACDGAMMAAELLAAAGDAGYLPRWSATASPGALTRALCLIAGLERPDRRTYLRDFLPPTGAVSVFHEVCPGERPLVPAGRDEVTRGSVRGDELPQAVRANSPSCTAATPPRCDFVGDNRTFSFEFQLIAGARHLASIQSNPMTGCD